MHLAVQLAGSCLACMGGGFLYPLLIFVANLNWQFTKTRQ